MPKGVIRKPEEEIYIYTYIERERFVMLSNTVYNNVSLLLVTAYLGSKIL
jgi:hypothetical protein